MDKLSQYRSWIKQVLAEQSRYQPIQGQIEVQLLCNESQDDYQIFHLGWDEDDRIHHCLVHIRLRDGKIWIENDDTEVGIANLLVELGAAKAEIVLAYHASYMRHFSDYAVS